MSEAARRTDDLKSAKHLARKQAEARRASAHSLAKDTAPMALAATGLDFLGCEPTIVSGFLAYQTEINILPLLERLTREGWRTTLPVVKGAARPLEFRLWAPDEPTVPGVWNIPVPPETAQTVDPKVLLVPLLAFDADGYRLGYGGGFYDRTLEQLRSRGKIVAIGIAYQDQQAETLPRDAHDQPLDWILTESGARKIARQGQ